jgi:hypothetical protein
VAVKHSLLTSRFHLNGHSKMEHFGHAFIPKVPAQCHFKTLNLPADVIAHAYIPALTMG